DLLELVEDEGHTPSALCGELGRELEQSLERGIDVRRRETGAEPEPNTTVLGVDRDGRTDSQSPEDVGRALARPHQRRRDLVVDRLGQPRREQLLRRGPHQVDLRDERLAAGDELAARPPHEGALAVPTWGEHHDVLAVPNVGGQLTELELSVREHLVERQIAEIEGIFSHRRIIRILASRMYATDDYASASAAKRRPTAGANLNPCPEQAEPTTTRPRRSSTKVWS